MLNLKEWIKSKNKKFYLSVLLLTAVALTGGILWHNQRQARSIAEDIPLVRTMIIAPAAAGQNYTYSGEVRGRYESQLAFQAGGKLIKRNVELGSTVKAGDILMQLDPKDLQQAVNSTSAQLESARSQLHLAQSNLERYRQLFEQNAISRAQLDQYQNSYDVALAAVRQAEAQHAQGANQLDYSLLYADKPGVVARISAETGQVVSAGQTVIVLVQDGEREIEISVPENRLESLRQASSINVTFWALPGLTVEGRLREVAPAADQTTRTYKVRISLPQAPPEIQLGMTAAVNVVTSGSQPSTVATIPLSAVYQINDAPAVWVVSGDTVHLQPVQVGQFGQSDLQVLGGLNPGDTIVTAGVHKLREGQKVRINAGGTS